MSRIFHIFFATLINVAFLSDVCSQSTVIDSLERILKKEKNDSARVDLLTQLSKNYDNVDTGKARSYYRQLRELADRSGNEMYQGYADELAGVLYTRYDKKLALQYYNAALEILSKHQETMRVKRSVASLNNNLGVMHYMNGDMEGALRYFMEAVKFYEQYVPFDNNLGLGYGNISTVYADLGKRGNAVTYSKKALEFAEKFPDNKGGLMVGYNSYGSNLLKIKNTAEGMRYMEKAKLLATELDNKYYLYLYYNNLGEYYYYEKDYKTSLANYQATLHYARLLASPGEICYALHAVGTCYMYLTDYVSARKYLDTVEAIIKEKQLTTMNSTLYDALAELYERTGDYKNALVFKSKYIAIRDSNYAADNTRRIEFLDAQYQAEKKEKDILRLQTERQAQTFAIKRKSTWNYVLLGSVIALLILGFSGYRIFRNRQQLSRQEAILSQQQIRELEKDKQLIAVDSLLKGQEEERSRLAKDLHDGLGGLLSGVKFSISNMKDNLIVTPENMAVFERSLDMIDGSIKELRRVAHNMMPEMLTKFGLDEALKEYCNSLTATKLLSVRYQSFGLDERIDKSVEIIIYRIIQELLNNTLKHAVATEVSVQLVREKNRINVQVEDNGKGFNTAILDDNKGSGWMSIRSRVDYLKGKLEVSSGEGKGTSVNIEFAV